VRAWVTGAVVGLCAATWAPAQTYSVQALSTRPGGMSTGGVYAVRASVETPGQPPGGGVSGGGGAYTVTAGILGIHAVQNLQGPRLRIRGLSNGKVELSWPVSAVGYTLQVCGDLLLPSWNPAPEVPVGDGVWNSVEVQSTGLTRYYRLRRPPD